MIRVLNQNKYTSQCILVPTVPLSEFCSTPYFLDISGQPSILPILPGAVVQSQLFSMAQHHLDSARTSLCGWGRGICTSPNCVVLGLHHNIVRGCSVRAGKKSAVSLRCFLTVWQDSARTTSPRNETPEPHWLVGKRNRTTYCGTTN